MDVRVRLAGAAGSLLRNRWVVRAPIGVYRAGLGMVFGRRLLMLEHRGRRTGLKRYVVLEVVDRPATDRYVIVSGFGPASQWYRNVLADPDVRISIGMQRMVPATARAMTVDESDRALQRYQRNHPWAWQALAPVLRSVLGSDDLHLPMVELTVRRP